MQRCDISQWHHFSIAMSLVFIMRLFDFYFNWGWYEVCEIVLSQTGGYANLVWKNKRFDEEGYMKMLGYISIFQGFALQAIDSDNGV